MALVHLLYRGESESLDFKRDQYPFSSKDDRTKSELLKDILAMANSWRTETAYILIGVDDSVSPAQVVGVSDHFDDAVLQQFVNGKTQRPLKFSYCRKEIQGQSVGVIEIPVQSRPIYLRNDFGKLKANTVYLRRGSSTAEASPDEITQMAATSPNLKDTDLQVRFAKPGTRELDGAKLTFESRVHFVKEENTIPNFEPSAPGGLYLPTLSKRPNADFYRELVQSVKQSHLLRKAALTVTNAGVLPAKEIRVEFSLPDARREWEFCEEGDYVTDMPKRYHDLFRPGKWAPPYSRPQSEPDCELRYLEGIWHLPFEFGYLQPGRTLWPALEFYVGARHNGAVTLQGRVMADSLPAAAVCALELVAKVSECEVSLCDLVTRYDESTESDAD